MQKPAKSRQLQQTAGMDATDMPQLPLKTEAIQHAEADMHAHAPCHTLSKVQLPPGLDSQPSLVFQGALKAFLKTSRQTSLRMCSRYLSSPVKLRY